MDEIIKIVFRRNKERKLLTPDDVKRICYIILKKNKYDFVKYVKILPTNSSDSSCAGVYYQKYIFFFVQQIIDMIHNNFEKLSNTIKFEGAEIDVYNYLYLNIIFHELAHVRQYAIMNGNRRSIEKKLFSLFLTLSHNRDFYEENYCNFLTEVNANNVSIMTTNYIYSQLPKAFLTANDWKAYQVFLLKTMFYDNYEIIPQKDNILSPAERVVGNFDEELLFYLDTNLDDYIELIYNTDKLTIYKKMMLGLPISYSEYAYSNLVGDRLLAGGSEKINLVKKLQKKLNSPNRG